MGPAVRIDRSKLGAFCRRHHIRRLALFGSVLRDDFGADSDVDVLMEFETGHIPGFIALFSIEEELSEIFGGRKVDLVTEKSLSRRIRPVVLAEAQMQYGDR